MAFTSEGVGGAVITGLTSTSGDLTVGGDLTVTGNDITFGNAAKLTDGIGYISIEKPGSSGHFGFLIKTQNAGTDSWLSFLEGTTIKWSLGNDGSDSDTFKISSNVGAVLHTDTELTLDTSGNLIITGDLTVSGNDITFGNGATISNSSDGTLALTEPLITTSAALTVGTNIKIADGGTIGTATTAAALTLAGNGNATLSGDLNVNGGDFVIKAANAVSATILLQADNSDDAGDDWKILAHTDNGLYFANDKASAGSYVNHMSITPHATVASSILSVAGYIVEGRTVIKIPPTAFISNDDYTLGVAVIDDDSSVYGVSVGAASAELYAYIDVPLGYTATKVRINGSDDDMDVEVYTVDLDAGTISSEISASGLQTNDDTDLDSNHVGADDKMLFIKVDTTATSDVVWGGYVTIEAT